MQRIASNVKRYHRRLQRPTEIDEDASDREIERALQNMRRIHRRSRRRLRELLELVFQRSDATSAMIEQVENRAEE